MGVVRRKLTQEHLTSPGVRAGRWAESRLSSTAKGKSYAIFLPLVAIPPIFGKLDPEQNQPQTSHALLVHTLDFVLYLTISLPTANLKNLLMNYT